jgi:hypothetical protein
MATLEEQLIGSLPNIVKDQTIQLEVLEKVRVALHQKILKKILMK